MMDIAAWRRETRLALYEARKAMSGEQRSDAVRAMTKALDDRCSRSRPALIGLYWPIKYEPNLLPWARARAGDLRFCLPVVVSKGGPLEYWLWTPGDKMHTGVWGIQVPAQREVVTPDLVIAPLLGFDRDRYRLGNGGGYFDRTLAVWKGPRRVVGIGYASGELETIYPQQHDIPMDEILTEKT